MTTETNAERLHIIKTESECEEIAGVKYMCIRLQDFDFLIQQSERAQVLEQEKEFFRRSFVELKAGDVITRKENTRLREALEFYADEDKWDEVNLSKDPWTPYYVREIHKDEGDTARQALNTQEDSK